jgi:hypothetical protein
MLTKSKIGLSIALVLATASAGMAAPKHRVRHHSAMVHSAMVQHLPARTYLSFGSAAGASRVAEPTYMRIQTIGNKWEEGESGL